MSETGTPFWERPEVVDEFAARDPDVRLRALVEDYPRPAEVRVLDLGCAGGRNTEFLVALGFDVSARDTSAAMVARTRARVAPRLGPDEAARRIRRGPMQDLAEFEAGTFDLVVALGVYHFASGDDEWHRSLAETARVLGPGGRLLVSIFSPRSAPEGELLRRLEPDGNLYAGFDSGPHYCLEADGLDRAAAAHGLVPAVPTDTVKADTESGYRRSVNALYVKQAD